LQAHCRSADHAISTVDLRIPQIATAGSANTAYRNYAHWIADELKYVPGNSKDKQCWLLALAYGRAEGVVDSDYEWVLRPELVETLQAMKWA